MPQTIVSQTVFANNTKEICVYNDKKNSIEILVNGVQIKSSDAAPFIDGNNRTRNPVELVEL